MKDRRSKEHKFNIEDAKEYGVECATILHNLRHWLDKNVANGKNVHDGRVWTYNSAKAFADLFPYLTEKQIYRRLKKLESEGILITGNYNKHNYDQTKWYTLNEDYYLIDESENTNSRNQEHQFPKSGNGNSESGKPIPDINPDINTNRKTNTNSLSKSLSNSTDKKGERDEWFNKDSSLDIPESKEDVIQYVKQQGWPEHIAVNFWNYYAEAGWCFPRGSNMVPVQNWRAKLHGDVNRGFHNKKPKKVDMDSIYAGSDI